jgi:carboxypeptidase Q
LFGFVPDSQRYFDFHHADTDVFESVNKRELELGCASIAAFLYLMDKGLVE